MLFTSSDRCLAPFTSYIESCFHVPPPCTAWEQELVYDVNGAKHLFGYIYPSMFAYAVSCFRALSSWNTGDLDTLLGSL